MPFASVLRCLGGWKEIPCMYCHTKKASPRLTEAKQGSDHKKIPTERWKRFLNRPDQCTVFIYSFASLA